MKPGLFFFIGFIFFSCSQKHEIPGEILAPPRMQAVLWDLMRTDQFVLNYGRKDSSSSVKDKSTRLYEQVFRIHNTTKSQFEKSISFYNVHPDLFKIVLDSLEKKKSTLIQQPYQSATVDSLRKKIKPAGIRK